LATYKSFHPTKAGEPIPPIVLYQCGTTRPSFGDAGVSTSAIRFFEIPIRRATVAWGGALPFFEMLGVTEFIHAIDMTFISAPCAQLMEVCEPGIHMKGGADEFKAHHKRMTPSNGSVVFTDSFGTGFSNSTWDIEFMVSVDPGTLNRAEWINFVAAFFNEEHQAAQIFSKISSDYNALKSLAIKLAGDTTTEWGGRQPLVAWTDSQPETCADPDTNCNSVGWVNVGGSWCHCGALYKISNAHYKRDMVEDAGGRLVSMPHGAGMPEGCSTATNTDGSQTLTCDPSGHAAFVQFLAEADVIFDESRIRGGTDSYDTTAHDFEGSYSVTAAEIPALARNPRNIFRLDGSTSDHRDGTRGNNWFEASKAQPQQLLAGMMEALWGESFHSPCGNKYLRRAIPGEGQEVLGHDDCPLYDEGGNHDCAAIHEHAHQIPQCSLGATIAPELLPTAECPAGAKPFPTDLAGKGRVDYANLFDIHYYGTYKVITFSPTLATYKSFHPTKAGEPIPPIVLYQCGTTRPSFGDAGVSTSAIRFFEIPIRRATVAWGGALPFFEMLGVTEFIHAIDMTFISAPCAQLMEVCEPGIHMKGGADEFKAHHKRMTPSNGSVVFTDSFGTGFSNSTWDIEFMVSVDPGTLNRAEWINFVAAFFNEEHQAAQIFSKISSDYNALKSLAIKLAGDTTTEWGGRQPLVAWTDSQPETCADPDTNCNSVGWVNVGGSWCHCGALYKISNAHYKRDMVEDAGGRLVSMPHGAGMPEGCSTATNTDGSQTLTCDPSGHAAFVQFLAEADVIFDESRIRGGTDSYDTTAHDFEGSYSVTAAEIPALARNPRNIFRLDGSTSDHRDGTRGNNWFEASKAQPQQLLAGMMEALWGESFHSPCGNKYLRRAIPGEGQEVLGHDDCPLYDEGGNHDCAAIHEHAHQIPQCSLGATIAPTSTTARRSASTRSTIHEHAEDSTTQSSEEDVSAAVTAKLSIAVLLAAIVRLRYIV